MAKKMTRDDKAIVREFLYSMGLVPSILITPEVLKLIYRSWEIEFQKQEIEEIKKREAREFLLRLRERSRRRKPCPVLNNMIPLNFDPEID